MYLPNIYSLLNFNLTLEDSNEYLPEYGLCFTIDGGNLPLLRSIICKANSSQKYISLKGNLQNLEVYIRSSEY